MSAIWTSVWSREVSAW